MAKHYTDDHGEKISHIDTGSYSEDGQVNPLALRSESIVGNILDV